MEAEDVLRLMINVLLKYMKELQGFQDKADEQFQYGEKTAYIECLEYIQMWRNAKENGLNFDIEKDYKI